MDILVDFDNIDNAMRSKGLQMVCTRMVHAIANKKATMPAMLRFRLYGGWFENESLTRRAQNLSSEIQRDFPSTIRWSGGTRTGTCVAQVEMAYALEIEPARKLTHTFRVRPFDAKIRCRLNLISKCTQSPCPTAAIAAFFNDKKCITQRCYMTPGDFLEKEDQKLADTMLTADLIYLATHGKSDLAVVSSDDDLWPGIQTALLSGARVMHLHTHKERQTRQSYSNGLLQYKETAL